MEDITGLAARQVFTTRLCVDHRSRSDQLLSVPREVVTQ